jgi:long-chain-fatty-acid--CoA ligase ACSBG
MSTGVTVFSKEGPVGSDMGQYNFYLSPSGLAQMPAQIDPKNPAKNMIWTTDPRVELPILMSKEGPASDTPMTLMQLWEKTLAKFGSQPAINDKINGKWRTYTYQQYYDLVVKFALGLVRLGISERSAVSILGYNCSEWFIDFNGAIFANCVSVGHYLTNGEEAIKFVIEHSDSEIFIAENQEMLDRVLPVWETIPNLKYEWEFTLGMWWFGNNLSCHQSMLNMQIEFYLMKHS